VARLNPAGSEIVTEVPNLRIVDDDIWDAVKRRQSEVSRPTIAALGWCTDNCVVILLIDREEMPTISLISGRAIAGHR
jgi:hypothetical protein